MLKAVDPVANALFGRDGFDEDGFLSNQLRLFVETSLRKSWRGFGLEVVRERTRAGILQEELKHLWKGIARSSSDHPHF